MCSPTMRITMSVALPGPNGTTTLTGLLGNLSWACAPNAVTARQSTRTDPNRRMGMSFLFLGGVRPRHRRTCDADVNVRVPDFAMLQALSRDRTSGRGELFRGFDLHLRGDVLPGLD